MALQFYAVHSAALAHTYDALQRLAQLKGRPAPGPTRALRVAQLYGHLQLRSGDRESFSLPLCELAASWRLQPKQLRQDLALLAQLGWLSAVGTSRGTEITLHPFEVPQPPHQEITLARSLSAAPWPSGVSWAVTSPIDGFGVSGGVMEGPAGFRRGTGAEGTVGDGTGASDAFTLHSPGLQPISAGETAIPDSASKSGAPEASDPQPSAARAPSPRRPSPSAEVAEPQLLARLTELYNLHKPPSWPAYHPRGHGLRAKLRQALRQSGGPDALVATLIAALQGMPAFWRTTYPQGRSGAECFAVLFSTDRGCAELGVEFWHLFTWAQAADTSSPGSLAKPDGHTASAASAADPLQRAGRLFLWDSSVWRGQGREALLLTLQEKRELTLLLEAHGQGIPGTAERQFAAPEPEVAPVQQPEPELRPEPDQKPEPGNRALHQPQCCQPCQSPLPQDRAAPS
jgi:hypothetical protein